MAIEIIKKRYPILDENGQSSTYPTFASQVFFDDGSVLESKNIVGLTSAPKEPDTPYEQASFPINADTLEWKSASDFLGVNDTAKNSEALENMTYQMIVNAIYPTGIAVFFFEAQDPNTLYPWQTWERAAQGRFILGADDTNYMLGDEGGETEHTLTVDEIPSHNHGNWYEIASSASDKYITKGSSPTLGDLARATTMTGGSQPHNNMPPYIAANIWKRVS